MNSYGCAECRYNKADKIDRNGYPCNQCKNYYTSMYEPFPDLEVGDMVIIKDDIDHDIGCRDSVGVVQQVNNMPCNNVNENYYHVVVYDDKAERYLCCGFNRSSLIKTEQKLQDLNNAFEYWKNN